VHLTGTGYKSTVLTFLTCFRSIREFDKAMARILVDEPLRQAIVAKNELFFYRWRPQNETYLFGFRKHEQGNNAKEVAEFDPLVAKAEEEIERIRKKLND